MPFPLALGLSLLPSVFQGIQGIFQKNQASDLKESQYIPPELTMNRDLAQQQAYSRRAPGQAQAEENIRRIQANQMSAAQRSFGGNANKMAAVAAGAAGQANQANRGLQVAGQQFSENAFGRMGQANSAIAEQKRQNRMQFLQAKNALNQAGDQNLFNAVSNAASAGITSLANGDWQGIDSGLKKQANSMIAQGKGKGGFVGLQNEYDPTLNTGGPLGTKNPLGKQVAIPGVGQYSAIGKQMKQQARLKLKQQNGVGPAGLWNNGYDPMAMYPGGYGPGWNLPGYAPRGRGYVGAYPNN